MGNSSFFQVLLAGGVLLVITSVRADIVTLTPVADTSLVESAPDNNLGAQTFLEAGVIETGGVLKLLRGLVRFDLSQIPTNAVISNATLRVTVVLNSTNPYPEYLELHRMLQSWTEGNKSGGTNESGNLGAPATVGESTWNHRQQPSLAWASPGGSNGGDFVANASDFAIVYSVSNVYSISNYTFSSGLLADVRRWVTNAAGNYGWMLKPTIETSLTGGAARRFGSREDSTNAPVLTVTYGIPIPVIPVITTTSPLPSGATGTVYSRTFFATGSTAPYTWSLASGSLPGGLTLSSGGLLSGAPTNAGAFNFSVRVTDSIGTAATNSFALTIVTSPLNIPSGLRGEFVLAEAILNVPYLESLPVTGGAPPYSWSLLSGTLPEGINLSTAGVLSGTPTNAANRGDIRLGVQVQDSLGATDSAYVVLPFNPPVDSPLRLNHLRIVGGQIRFEMTVSGGYTNVVQYRDIFDTNVWTTLTNVTVPITTNVTISDPANQPMRFYRFYYNTTGGGTK